MLITASDKLTASESIAITNRAAELRAQGRHITTLSIGDAHFRAPEAIRSRMIEAIAANQTHYTPPAGITALRDLVAKNFFKDQFRAEQILMVPGLKQGLFYLFESLPGTHITAIEPTWLGYRYSTILTGKKYIAVNRYSADWIDDLAKTEFQILVICTPNNPDGYQFSSQELERIAEIARKKNAWLIMDCIYDQFLYDETSKVIAGMELYDKIIFCNGFSKSHAMTGMRLGFLGIPDKDIFSSCLRMQEHLATCPGSVAQYGALGFPEAQFEVSEYKEYYAQNRRTAIEIVPELARVMPDGGFYFFMDISGSKHPDGAEFAERLLEDHGVAVVPGIAYGSGFRSYIRISFSIEHDEFISGLRKIKDFLER